MWFSLVLAYHVSNVKGSGSAVAPQVDISTVLP